MSAREKIKEIIFVLYPQTQYLLSPDVIDEILDCPTLKSPPSEPGDYIDLTEMLNLVAAASTVIGTVIQIYQLKKCESNKSIAKEVSLKHPEEVKKIPSLQNAIEVTIKVHGSAHE